MNTEVSIDPQAAELISGFPVSKSIEVQWADMDAGQMVHNSQYLKWFEVARIAYMFALEIKMNQLSNRFFPVVGWSECKYIFPVTFPDTILMGIKITEMDTDRFVHTCHMVSNRHQRLVAIASARMVGFDPIQKSKVDLPEELVKRIKKLESNP